MEDKNPLIILPTYCEAANIRLMIEAILSLPIEADILVVDDNSPDGTGQAVKALKESYPNRVNLLSRRQKEGLAKAYFAGFDWAFRRNYSIVVQMDADFSHNPKDIPRLLSALKGREAVFGSRYVPGGDTPDWNWDRKLISRIANTYARKVLGLGINDCTGGFNVWRARTLRQLIQKPLIMQGYGFLIELKHRLLRMGSEYQEVPIIFMDRTRGTSKLSTGIMGEALFGVLRVLWSAGAQFQESQDPYTTSYK